MEFLEDLRLFIGSFFLIIGIILLVHGVLSPVLSEGFNLDLIVGGGFVVFALAALTSLLLSFRSKSRSDKGSVR